MFGIDDEDDQFPILDLRENAIVIDAISPDALQVAFEGLAVTIGIVASFEVLIDPFDDKLPRACIHFVQRFAGTFVVDDVVRHLNPNSLIISSCV